MARTGFIENCEFSHQCFCILSQSRPAWLRFDRSQTSLVLRVFDPSPAPPEGLSQLDGRFAYGACFSDSFEDSQSPFTDDCHAGLVLDPHLGPDLEVHLRPSLWEALSLQFTLTSARSRPRTVDAVHHTSHLWPAS